MYSNYAEMIMKNKLLSVSLCGSNKCKSFKSCWNDNEILKLLSHQFGSNESNYCIVMHHASVVKSIYISFKYICVGLPSYVQAPSSFLFRPTTTVPLLIALENLPVFFLALLVVVEDPEQTPLFKTSPPLCLPDIQTHPCRSLLFLFLFLLPQTSLK